MANVFDYTFNLVGNYLEKIGSLTKATEKFTEKEKDAQKATTDWTKKLMGFEAAVNVARNAVDGIQNLTKAGVSLDSQMHDLSAVAGVTGDSLKQIEGYARESAKAFGTDASEAVTGYKLLLSQLSPELGKYPEALKAMGNNIQTTAKLMGGDGVAAAEVLTTAMNQYGVSLDDPMKASEEMARMMNVMAAAGQAGSAELPAIKVALEQCGMAAKSAGVSFEETNAAIQVLDKAGKKGSEGGVALRNVMATLAQGRFLPKDVQKELSAAGIDVIALGDKSKSLKERLEMLKPVMQDSALFSKLFGRENANAALALVGGTEALGNFTEAVTDTKSAEEQAGIIMDSYAERQARINKKIEDMKIGLFQATGDLTLWMTTLGESLIPLSQLMPLLSGVGKVLRFVLPIAFTAFRTAATVACRAVSAAFFSIPIVGWVALAITALGALAVYFYNTSAKFRAVVWGIGSVVEEFVNIIKGYFSALADLLDSAFNLNPKGMKEAIGKLIHTYTDFGSNIAKAYRTGYDRSMHNSKREAAEEKKEGEEGTGDLLAGIPAITQDVPTNPLGNTLGNVGRSSGGGSGSESGGKIRNITINVDRLVERLEVHVATAREGADRIREMVTETLLGALNDVNLAV